MATRSTTQNTNGNVVPIRPTPAPTPAVDDGPVVQTIPTGGVHNGLDGISSMVIDTDIETLTAATLFAASRHGVRILAVLPYTKWDGTPANLIISQQALPKEEGRV